MSNPQRTASLGLLIVTLTSFLSHSTAQTASTAPVSQMNRHKIAFDVISVKQNDSGVADADMGLNQDSFRARNVDVNMLLTAAFHVFDSQLVGEPKWAKNDRWDIQAKVAAEDIPSLQKLTFLDRLDMFQDILKERFGLRAHHEIRELPVYALVVANGGPKMTKSKSQPDLDAGMEGAPGTLNGRKGKEVAEGALIRYLCEDLQDYVGRPIVDRTGLTGRYDFTLQWNPDDDPTSSATSNALPSLFTAVQEQLGLKLEATKAPMDVIVIDALDKPTAN